ncbi:hypothetical protein KXD40_005887 [Peronospora effusa]|uniref:Uncharacterized protein n=1 Tax=Peronospora effusa TaxID=542832 RepID=A0A3M6VNT2_9STRA|nr:hypothetical protein DD238_001470 [Peronospora effusa]UIZ27208.1 hypothetical protein KXD40_005887 [Peronospora effusa]
MKHQFDRLAEDHINAQVFAYGISSIRGIEIDPNAVESEHRLFQVDFGCQAGRNDAGTET